MSVEVQGWRPGDVECARSTPARVNIKQPLNSGYHEHLSVNFRLPATDTLDYLYFSIPVLALFSGPEHTSVSRDDLLKFRDIACKATSRSAYVVVDQRFVRPPLCNFVLDRLVAIKLKYYLIDQIVNASNANIQKNSCLLAIGLRPGSFWYGPFLSGTNYLCRTLFHGYQDKSDPRSTNSLCHQMFLMQGVIL